MLVKIPNVKFRENSLGRGRRSYTGGRTDERTNEQKDLRNIMVAFQNFFAKAPKYASYRNSVVGYALVSSGSVRGRVGLDVQQKVANFFVS
jgi:hypothetical protein